MFASSLTLIVLVYICLHIFKAQVHERQKITSSGVNNIRRRLNEKNNVVYKNEVQTKEKWLSLSQEGELNFWMSHWKAMVNPKYKKLWIQQYSQYFKDNGGFNTTLDFVNKVVLDIGSGPRPLSYAMEGIELYCIEPLGERFLKEAGIRLKDKDGYFLELQKAKKVFSVPAEELVLEMVGKVDVVLTTNSLDHTWDPTTYLKNAKKYLKQNGFVYLIVDLHHKTEPMHPEKSLVPTIINHIYDAGLRFDRGACTSPAAHPGLAFNSCWFILSINKDYDHEKESR